MSYLVSIRQQQQSWGHRALGLFVAVWLNLVLQPCAMALQSDDYDCSHCPPAQMAEHTGMHGSMGHNAPCADGMSDCVTADDLNHDGRSGQFKLKDAPADTPIAIAPHELAVPFRQPADAALHPCFALLHAGAAPPLYILNCVYLK